MSAQGRDGHAWWAALRHGGLLLSPVVLDEWLPGGLPALDDRPYRRLRDRFTAFQAKTAGDGHGAAVHEWLDALLEEFLGHPKERWKKGADIPEKVTATSVTGQRLRPHRVLLGESGSPSVLVAVDDSPRVGMHRGRRAHARFVELLRLTGHRLGLLTNGRQFRLCYAGLDHDAWCEWEAEAWFAEGETRCQLQGLIALLGPDAFRVVNGAPRLHAAVEASRSRQGELSQVLGDQVRRAVELLVNGLDAAARNDAGFLESLYQNPSGARLSEKDALAAIYQAATRLVMRLVVTFFAEARDLLPRSQPIYEEAYGVEGLFAQLESAARHEGLRGLEGQRGAWPRILGLFRLIHGGSHHEALPVPAYGGTLFRAGDASARDPVLRAMALFEDARVELSDRAALELLRLLKIGRIRVRRGTASAWVAGPVDFSDLRTEYIGIMYEGLLDYELRRVSAESPMLVLGLGKEPVLPLSLLEGLSDRDLEDLVEKLAKEKDSGPAPEEGGEDAEDEEPEAEPAAEEEPVDVAAEEEAEEPTEASDAETALGNRAMAWAMRAVEVGGLIRRSRAKKADQEALDRQKAARARSLLRRVLAPAEMYLVRWGGTRKGAGAFYTRPQLAVPTTHRTLEPLVYETVDGIRKPRTPEEILALKVCDLAMGSASFLIAALRYLTEALYESLLAHGRILQQKDTKLVVLPFGEKASGKLSDDLPPVPFDDEQFEQRLKARLKRYVVERCLYGVDINPLAVELARLSLWVETMDRELPFEFLDHRLKVGNSLVGCWFDRFQDYPALAWAREGGDGPKGAITKKIRDILNTRVKPELRAMLERRGPQLRLGIGEARRTAEEVQTANLDAFRRLEAVPLTDPDGERERIFREEIQRGAELTALRHAFNRWCAIWFWPVSEINASFLLPSNFAAADPAIDAIVTDLAERHKFFHWELEFPDVFVREHPGFDAILGNPPWDIQKPNSSDFFSNYDPIYRSYGKQEALSHQQRLFEEDPTIEVEWLRYVGDFKGMGNWVRSAADPFDVSLARGGEGEELKRVWKNVRTGHKGYAGTDYPFRHQGSADINSYKLFLETAHYALRAGGRLGFLVPSGIYTDKGTADLRRLFLDRCRWEWLFGMINWKKVFASIYYRFKFSPLIIEKGGTTEAVRCAFTRYEVGDWESSDPPYVWIPRSSVVRFSPNTLSFMEFKSKREMEICEKIYANHPLLGEKNEGCWNVEFGTEFHMIKERDEAQVRLDAALIRLEIIPEAKGRLTVVAGEEIGPRSLEPRAATVVKGSPEVVVDLPGVARVRARGPAVEVEGIRADRDRASQRLKSLTEGFGTSDLDALEMLGAKARLLDEGVAKAETQLTTLLAGESVEVLEQERIRLKAFCGGLVERYPAWGEKPPEARGLAAEAQEIRRAFIARVEGAEAAWKAAQKARSAVAEQRAGLEAQAKGAERQGELLATKLADLTADGKQPVERETELRRIALAWEATRAGLEGIEKALAEFGADPRDDVRRLERQLQAADEMASKALAEESREEGRLESLSAQGPYSALARTEEEVARLRRELAIEELRIAGVKLLCDTVAECRSAALAAVAAPVEAAATRMLQRIAGSRLGRVQLGDTFEPGHVIPELAEGSVSVEQVSGGEREQIYLATRLALADVLARGERQLVVLDDVLTATDSGRLARVMGALEEAAQRLQVLILTCHPERYRGLAGANFVDLEGIVRGAG